MNFSFNFEKYNYWPLYEAINQYYPIGISSDFEGIQDYAWHVYPQFKGQKAFGDIITGNFVDQSVFINMWEAIGKSLAGETDLRYVGTTYGEVPSYSFYLELSATETGNHTIFKRLHVAISLLGPFYSIWGEDGSVLKIKERYYPATNVITVSPFDEFANVFNTALMAMQSKFPDFRFVPHSIHNKVIPGLEFRKYSWPSGKKGLIYHALFNFLQTGYEVTRGDINFSSNLWEK